MRLLVLLTALMLAVSVSVGAVVFAADSAAHVQLKNDEPHGRLQILVDGKEAIVYRYGKDVDLPHYYPVRSPSGQLLTVQQTDPYPHHRSIWFADTVQLAGQRKVSVYNSFYTKDKKRPEAGFRDRARHVKFLAEDTAGKTADVKAQLIWEGDFGKIPVIDELRHWRVVSLENGEYLLDLRFELRAAYGDVTFSSDCTHYAWPYVRMHQQFSMAKGGMMTSSEGPIPKGDIGKNGLYTKRAHWIDYSGTVDGVTEGLAIFATDKEPPRWFTRDYGTFGPRRVDTQSGTHFTLKKGESLKQHVAILVHSGDVNGGRVKQRYQQYIDGKL